MARKLPWYRRFRRQTRPLAAGERPRQMGERRKPGRSIAKTLFLLALVAVVIAPIAGYVAVPDIRERANAAFADLRLRFLPRIEDVHPGAVSGKGVGGHPGSDAGDDDRTTYWLADPGANAVAVTITFNQTTDLGGIIFHPGSATDSSFQRHRRPKTVRLTTPGKPPVEVVVADTSEPVPLTIDIRGVDTLEVRIVDWWESAQGGDKLIALREIEFKARR